MSVLESCEDSSLDFANEWEQSSKRLSNGEADNNEKRFIKE